MYEEPPLNPNDIIYPEPTLAAGSMGDGVIFPLLLLIIYGYFAYCLYKIAQKTNTPNSWFAFIPLLNVILMVQIARKSLWWVLALLVPAVNIFVAIWIWMLIAEERRRPKWWGILMIVGPINLILLYFLAFREMHDQVQPTSPGNLPSSAA